MNKRTELDYSSYLIHPKLRIEETDEQEDDLERDFSDGKNRRAVSQLGVGTTQDKILNDEIGKYQKKQKELFQILKNKLDQIDGEVDSYEDENRYGGGHHHHHKSKKSKSTLDYESTSVRPSMHNTMRRIDKNR